MYVNDYIWTLTKLNNGLLLGCLWLMISQASHLDNSKTLSAGNNFFLADESLSRNNPLPMFAFS